MLKRNRQGQLKPTQNVKVTVKGKQLPRVVHIFGANFRPELYVFPVKQCSICWKFGHSKTKCAGKGKCRICGKEHEPNAECANAPFCVNCKKGHASDSDKCPERERRRKIIKEMESRGVTYTEAERAFPRTQNRFDGLHDESDDPVLADPASTQPLYTGAVPKRRGPREVRWMDPTSSSSREISAKPPRRGSEESCSEVAKGSSYRTTIRNDRRQDNINGPELSHAASNRQRVTPERYMPRNPRRECPATSSSSESSTQLWPSEERERYNEIAVGNPHRVTEIEKLLAQLRKDILKLCRTSVWLEPVGEVLRMLKQRIQQERTEIETDQLLIEVSMQLETIIQHGEHETTPQNSTQTNNNGQ